MIELSRVEKTAAAREKNRPEISMASLCGDSTSCASDEL
jgi:hypothetical protein